MKKTCKYCNYKWESRKRNPRSCPRCKRRLDYPSKMIEEDKDENKQTFKY